MQQVLSFGKEIELIYIINLKTRNKELSVIGGPMSRFSTN